jgi:hypothetical protein
MGQALLSHVVARRLQRLPCKQPKPKLLASESSRTAKSSRSVVGAGLVALPLSEPAVAVATLPLPALPGAGAAVLTLVLPKRCSLWSLQSGSYLQATMLLLHTMQLLPLCFLRPLLQRLPLPPCPNSNHSCCQAQVVCFLWLPLQRLPLLHCLSSSHSCHQAPHAGHPSQLPGPRHLPPVQWKCRHPHCSGVMSSRSSTA